jgi:hypothetical protein
MTRGQIAQLQELAKCWNVPRMYEGFIHIWLDPFWTDRDGDKMGEWDKRRLRRLTHQYRHQIAAMRKNRGKA